MDRNFAVSVPNWWNEKSLPARGAWIEIILAWFGSREHPVAPREGSVDRNILDLVFFGFGVQSLPARGAWIEMKKWSLIFSASESRSPRGERG